jgi:hypothetical protein
VQLTARDDPTIKPNPLDTLQVSTPICTPWARAGLSKLKAPPTKASAVAAIPILLSIA